MKLVLFSDLDGRPVYVNAELVTHLTKLAETQNRYPFRARPSGACAQGYSDRSGNAGPTEWTFRVGDGESR